MAMSSEPRDITDIVLQHSELPRDIEAVRRKCLSLPMVSECEATLSSFKGRALDAATYQVELVGSVRVKTSMKLGITLDAAGVGEIDSAGQILHITDVKILNDFHGLFGRMLDLTGLVAGSKLKLRSSDSAVIRAALAA